MSDILVTMAIMWAGWTEYRMWVHRSFLEAHNALFRMHSRILNGVPPEEVGQ